MSSAPTTQPSPPRTHAFVTSFIGLDLLAFTVLFVLFVVERSGQVNAFDRAAGMLDIRLGAANTLLLITSGLMTALAVTHARARRYDLVSRYLGLSMLTGLGFGVIKIFEWVTKAGVAEFTSSPFGLIYFSFTALHFLHYVIGMIVLFMLRKRARSADPGPGFLTFIECGGAYWHMVDLIWVFLFPLLYVLRSAA